jgi:cation transport ATPase
VNKKTREFLTLSSIILSYGVFDYILYRYSIVKTLSEKLINSLSNKINVVIYIALILIAAISIYVSILLNKKENQRDQIRVWMIIVIIVTFFLGGFLSMLTGRIILNELLNFQ